MGDVITMRGDKPQAAVHISPDDEARINALLQNLDIEEIVATEERITVVFTSCAYLHFLAREDCCDSSWFVLSDVETVDLEPRGDWLRNPDRHAKFLGYSLVTAASVGLKESNDGKRVTYLVQIHTTRGAYSARMANNGGDSGYYSGSVTVSATYGFDSDHTENHDEFLDFYTKLIISRNEAAKRD